MLKVYMPIDFLKIVYDVNYVLTNFFIAMYFWYCSVKDSLQLFEIKDVKNIYSVDETERQVLQNREFIDVVLEPEIRKAEKFLKENLGWCEN